MTKLEHNWLNRKVLLFFSGVVASLLILLLPHKVSAFGYDWDISSFDTDITVHEDSSLTVRETIVADFSREAHHGIYRTIPVQYRDATNHTLKLRYNVVSVQDENGNDWWYRTSREGDYLKIQTGDPDIMAREPLTFVITYEIQRAVSFQFDDHDELYWNATGDEWEVDILQASASIHLPESAETDDIRATCYTGSYGSTAQDCAESITGNSVTYTSNNPLPPYSGLTIVAGFPKGVIQQPSFAQQTIWFLSDNWPYMLPVLTFLILLYLWQTRGRDPQTNRDTVMPHYEAPKGISPAEAGTLIDETVDMHDISSTIVDMAVRGYIKIKEIKKKKILWGEEFDYEFIKLKPFDNAPELHSHEKKTLSAVFDNNESRKLSDLKNKFYKDLPGIKDSIYDHLVSERYFPRSPEKVRAIYYGTGMFMIFAPLFTFGIFIEGLISLPISIAISGVIVLIFAGKMPAKTKKGVEMYYTILGLEEFIDTAEADRIKWQEKENIFMKLLPYAMAFHIADKWSKAFEGLNKVPNWYESNDPNFVNNFNTFYFVNRLSSMQSTMATTMRSAPRSSGSSGSWSGGSGFSGGSSGGGFGGGGGGSW